MIRVDLNDARGISKAITELKKYKADLLKKGTKFCQELGKRGISVSQANAGTFGQYIRFDITPKSNTNDMVSFVYSASSANQVTITWDSGSYEIDPLLMAEFGSGWNAYNVWALPNVGQGTHPQQTHAYDTKGWFWSENGTTYHSYGLNPSLPVYKAMKEMQKSLEEVAKEVFR